MKIEAKSDSTTMASSLSSKICCGIDRHFPFLGCFGNANGNGGSNGNAIAAGQQPTPVGVGQQQQQRHSNMSPTAEKEEERRERTSAGAATQKSMHNQVAPIVEEPGHQQQQVQEKQQQGNGVDKAKNATPRLDGWTEGEIMRWSPSDYEKDLVKRTWSDDFDFLYELGAAIYTYIFEHNPQTKVLFPKIHQHGDAWKDSADFRSQALKFVQTISYTAKNLYHMDEMCQPRLFRIGEHHVKYAERGFKPEYWDIFLDAMECAFTEHIRSIVSFTDQQKSDATRVWRQLAHYIIAHMKCGYQAEEAKQKHKKSK